MSQHKIKWKPRRQTVLKSGDIEEKLFMNNNVLRSQPRSQSSRRDLGRAKRATEAYKLARFISQKFISEKPALTFSQENRYRFYPLWVTNRII